MNISGYGFYFEKQGLSGEEGPIDAAQQYFRGSHADHAVMRETGQNSLDNPSENPGPVRMEFELVKMRTIDIPGIEELRNHIEAAASQTIGQQGHDRMTKAAELAKQDVIQVLRISDFNTTGLTGSESLATGASPLSRLTRGKGGSSDDGRGGSFGIGSAAAPSVSDLCTVIYTSLPEDAPRSVMAGYTRLATHKVGETSFRAEGYFTCLTGNDFKYLRPAPAISPFKARTEPGTDIYILGYSMADQDPELENVRDAMIDNFMVAIARNNLVVEGIAPGNHWTLDAKTLEGFAKRRMEAHAFYVALQDPSPAEITLKHIGPAKLYVNIDDRLPKKLHTITMRAPLMKIDTFIHNSISAKYAAILICDDSDGNKYLRELEPPQHHKWDAAREPVNGKSVIDKLKAFVRDTLRDRVSAEIGDIVEIEGLARFLPADTVGANVPGNATAPASEPDTLSSDTESSKVAGDPFSNKPSIQPSGAKVRIKIRRSATNAGEEDSEVGVGKEQRGVINRKHKRGPFEGKGDDGEGTSRIRSRDLSFRSWSTQNMDEGNAVIALAITADHDEAGDLELIALGSGGDPEQGYVLDISRVVVHHNGKTDDLKFSGNILKNLILKGGEMKRIDVYVPAGERYRLGVA